MCFGAPNVVRFSHFGFDACFVRQRRTLFGPIKFQKPSDSVLLHLDFEICLAPRLRALFWHVNCQIALGMGGFHFLTSKSASRHKGTQFLSSHLTIDGSAPAALASLLFDPLEPQSIGKQSASRFFYLFADLDLLSTDSFSSDSFSSLTALVTVAASVHK